VTLDFYSRDTQEALEIAGRRPTLGADPGFGATFSAGFQDAQTRQSLSEGRARFEYIEPFIKQYEESTGRNLPQNPETQSPQDQDRFYRAIRREFQRWNEENPTNPLEFPDEDQIATGAADLMRGRREAAAEVTERGTSLSSGAGEFAGGMAGAITDPINAISLLFGAGAASGIVKTALVEGGIGVTSQALIEAANFDFNRQIDEDFGISDAAASVAFAGFGGVLFGGGIKALAAGWHRVWQGSWPSHVRDAANLLQREAAVARPPQKTTPAGENVHRMALEKAAEDIAASRPVEIPQEALSQSQARSGRVFDAEGRAIDVEYQIVEAGDLSTSNLDDFSVNPDFPPELQPRDRTRALSQEQVIAISARLQPERLGPSPQAESGAPIVGPDGIVESGNARVMAIRRAYELNRARANNYRDFLKSQGFDLDGFDRPVLIARRVSDLEADQRIAFVNAANQATALRLGAAEQALADARLLDESLLARLESGDVGAASNRRFVSEFMKRLPRGEQGQLIDAEGRLSQAGVDRLRGAIMGRAYGEPVLLGRALEDRDSNIKALSGALADAGGEWAQMRDAVARGQLPAGMDITTDLMDSMRTVMRARDQGRPVLELASQAEMFGGPSEVAKLLLRAMYNDDFGRPVSRARFSDVLKTYAEEARKNLAGERLLGEPLGVGDVLSTALAKAGREDLFNEAIERTTAHAADELIAAPETAETVIQEAQRIRAEDADVTIEVDGVEKRLGDWLDEADDELAAAKEIEDCALGRETE